MSSLGSIDPDTRSTGGARLSGRPAQTKATHARGLAAATDELAGWLADWPTGRLADWPTGLLTQMKVTHARELAAATDELAAAQREVEHLQKAAARAKQTERTLRHRNAMLEAVMKARSRRPRARHLFDRTVHRSSFRSARAVAPVARGAASGCVAAAFVREFFERTCVTASRHARLAVIGADGRRLRRWHRS